MKKYMTILMLVALVFSMTSCGIQQSPVGSDNSLVANLPEDHELGEPTPGSSAESNGIDDKKKLFHGEAFEVHLMDYHNFSGVFIDYVGRNNFEEWIKQTDVVNYDEDGYPILEDGCAVPKCTIYEFIKHFGISKEEFYDLWYYSRVYYLCDYDSDILFSDDEGLIEKYYRRNYGEREQMMALRFTELCFIDDLHGLYYDDPVYGEAFRKVYDLGYNRFSIPDLIYAADLPRSEVEECQESLKSKYSDIYNFYDYDFEMIYNQKEIIMEAMKTKMPEEINNMVRSVNGVPMSE